MEKDRRGEGPVEPPLPHEIPGFAAFGHLACRGLSNTRDLGGMPTSDGRRIKPGRLVRSGALHRATDDDLSLLQGAHRVVRVVDLRTELERSHDPDPAGRMLPETVFYDLPVFDTEELGITHGGGLLGDLKAFGRLNGAPYKVVEALYPQALLGEQGMRAYARFLEILLEAQSDATLWHCSEGKDRAGLASAIAECALGVPEDYICSDYLATNIFARTRAERVLDDLGRHHLARDADADVDALFYAYPDYLDAAFKAVGERYGSLLGYIEEGLDFGPDKQRELRDRYLEAVS